MLELAPAVLLALPLEDTFPVGSKHGVCLPGASLTIGEHCEVITLKNISYVWFYEFEYILLGGVFSKCLVEGCY